MTWELTRIVLAFFAGGCVAMFSVHARIRPTVRAVIKKGMLELVDEGRDTLARRAKVIAECEPFLEDLSVAYSKQDDALIERCRGRLKAKIDEAYEHQPLLIPSDVICEAHEAMHAPFTLAMQMEHMEAAYRMGRGTGGGVFQL